MLFPKPPRCVSYGAVVSMSLRKKESMELEEEKIKVVLSW
jgi:hypothetical protein